MNQRRPAPSNRQRGEFNLPRLMTICAILVAILLAQLYFMKGKAKARASGAAAPATAASSMSGAVSR